jgi:hypothetical protein
MTGNRITAKGIAQRQAASRKHGAYALERRGEGALQPVQRTRLQELKEQLASEPGRLEYRRELAAFLAMIVELGGANIREIAEAGGNIWDSSPVSRLGVYLNSLIRLLDGWPKEEGERYDITDILRGKDGKD